jgi:hypothetical protein
VSGLLGMISIGLFFTIGGRFGTLNDIFNGILAIMSSLLAWTLYSYFQKLAMPMSIVFLILAFIGTLFAIVGSVLVIFGFTGWYLAGIYTSAGFALLAFWLFGLSYAAFQNHFIPQNLVIYGMITSVIMAFGFAAIPGMIRSMDIQQYFPFTIASLWQVTFLGVYILYPAWCIWLSRVLMPK